MVINCSYESLHLLLRFRQFMQLPQHPTGFGDVGWVGVLEIAEAAEDAFGLMRLGPVVDQAGCFLAGVATRR